MKSAVSLRGSGEIVEETGRLLERIAGLNQSRIALKLGNERRRQENLRDCIKDELAVTRELIQVLEDYLRLRCGNDFRSHPEAQAIISGVLSGAVTVAELMTGSKAALISQPEGAG